MNYPDEFYYLLFHLAEELPIRALRPLYRLGYTPLQLLSLAESPPPELPLPAQLWSVIRNIGNKSATSGHTFSSVAESAWERICSLNAQVIGYHDPRFPVLLRQIPDVPLQLYLRGNPASLADPQIAVVGSRRASPGGLGNARSFARELVGSGLIVTSGLATGIDSAAHQAAITAGGETIAVLGTGIDQVYPRAHSTLAAAIVEHGALVTEFPPGTPPLPGHFPSRNRIIAGLSLGTLVVEAAVQSGSLITARLAIEYNREVFAIPGSIHQPQARGCHQLIRAGATLTETVADMLGQLGSSLATYLPSETSDGTTSQHPLTAAQGNILAVVGFEPTVLDTIIERTGIPVSELEELLLELELAGLLIASQGCYQRAIA